MTAPSQIWLPNVCRGVVVCLLAIYAALAAASVGTCETTPCCPQPRSGDQLWLVSQRGLGCDVERHAEQLKYWRYDREKRWVPSDLAELNGADDGRLLTTVFVHGNRIDSREAFTTGWTVYRALVRSADERPIRFVIWSWPSERVCGPLADARIKAARTDPAAYYLAWFLDRLDPDDPVSLWGHSLGARIVTGALHLLGGGQLAGHRLVERAHANRQKVQAVLIAAALDNDWLLADRFNGRAMSQVNGLLLVNNSCDALLQRYHRLDHRRSCRQALGFTGLARRCLDRESWSKVEQIDACCQVGRRHALADYLCAMNLMARMRSHLLFEPPRAMSQVNGTLAASDVPVVAD